MASKLLADCFCGARQIQLRSIFLSPCPRQPISQRLCKILRQALWNDYNSYPSLAHVGVLVERQAESTASP
jgi:hypothetical protein